MAQYRSLDHQRLIKTVARLSERIAQVFPPSGLAEVSLELLQTSRHIAREVGEIRRPLWKLRAIVGCIVAVIALLPLLVASMLEVPFALATFPEFMQTTEAGFNLLLLLAGGVLFLAGLENRIKRHRAYRALHELRSLAHVVDMHQMSKDPGIFHNPTHGMPREGRRPPVIHNPGDLWHYLAFSADLLGVVGKLAACMAEATTDRVVLDSVHEIEMLCTALSRKIWHKMSLLKPPGADWYEARRAKDPARLSDTAESR